MIRLTLAVYLCSLNNWSDERRRGTYLFVHYQQQDRFLVLNEHRDKANDGYRAVIIGKSVLGKNRLCGLHRFLTANQMLFELVGHTCPS
jgi:hypothetical protein